MHDHPLLAPALASLTEPLPADDLLSALGLRSGPAADAVLDELRATGRVIALGDGRLASGTAALDGIAFWHRIDPVEATTRRIGLGLDGLPALALVPDPAVMLVGDAVVPLIPWRGPVELDVDRGATFILPDGFAADLAAGDLIAFALDGLQLRVHLADDPALPDGPAAGPDEVAALGEALAAVADTRGHPLTVLRDRKRDRADQWVLDLQLHGGILAADHGAALRALHRLPLREAVVRAGGTSVACVVGGPGVSSRSLDTFMVGLVVAQGIETDSPQVFEACGVVAGALTGPGADGTDPANERAVAHALETLLDDPLVAQLVVGHLRRVHLGVAAEAERRLRTVQRSHPRAPGPAWARAVVMLRQGRGADARRLIDDVVAGLDDDLVRDWPMVVVLAAGLHEACGDIASAVDLTTRVYGPDEMSVLRRWLPAPPQVRRNDRCPCGSGSKAKACCLRTPPPLPLAERIPLLWHKLASWSVTQRAMLSDIAVLASRSIDRTEPHAVAQSIAAVHVDLFEEGGIGATLDEIGALLPPDERDVAIRWRTVRHRVWVVDHDDGDGPVWRDAITGSCTRVVGPADIETSIPPLAPGTHVIAALLPAPSGSLVAGRVAEVPADEVDRVAEMVELGSSFTMMTLVLGLHGGSLDDWIFPEAA